MTTMNTLPQLAEHSALNTDQLLDGRQDNPHWLEREKCVLHQTILGRDDFIFLQSTIKTLGKIVGLYIFKFLHPIELKFIF